MAFANCHETPMVFDWEKAARLIRDRLSEGTIEKASAGLRDDWEYTGGDIFKNGEPVPEDETYTYLSSRWAVPDLKIDNDIFDCYVMEDDYPNWNAHTYWPPEALKILGHPEKEQ